MLKTAIEIGLACLLSAGVALGVKTNANCANGQECDSPAAQVQVVIDGVGDFTADILAQLKGAFKVDLDANLPGLLGGGCSPCNSGGGGGGSGGGGDDGTGIEISVDVDTQPLSADVDASVDAEVKELADVDVDAEVEADLSAVLGDFFDDCNSLLGGLLDP